ncbi:MAG: peptidoglycan DD-metalloendopeptidase family protein [Pseudomonadales bacterium]
MWAWQSTAQWVRLSSLCLLITACSGSAIPVVERDTASGRPAKSVRQAMPASGTHSVRRGETLYSIAWMYGQDFKKLARNNNIPAPYVIHAGERLQLVSRAAASKTKQRVKPAAKPKLVATQRESAAWRWPTSGRVLSRFGQNSGGQLASKGIDIEGVLGQAVYSTRAGKVVYSGNGIRGYGNLLIVKHSAEYLSAYAYNSRLLVKEGQQVKDGQKIAEIGKSGVARQAKLHFEIRKAGKPVNPLSFLPKRG